MWKFIEKYLFPILFLTCLLLYWPSRKAGLTFDFVLWYDKYAQGGWSGIMTCFDYPGLHQLLHLVSYSMFHFFDKYWLGYFITYCLGHATIGYLIFHWLQRLSQVTQLNWDRNYFLFAALLFLVHPYNAEVVVWKVCIHYILCSIFLLLILKQYLFYVNDEKAGRIFTMVGLFAASFFTIEISYVIPGLVLLTIIFINAINKDFRKFKHHFAKIFMPLAGALFLLLLLNLKILGSWVGHYGAETHLDVNLVGMASSEIKYLIKHLFLWRYASFDLKNAIYDPLTQVHVARYFLYGIFAIIAFYFLRIQKLNRNTQTFFYGLFGFFILILPISNMFVYFLQIGLNDRFGFIASIFLPLILIPIFHIFPKKIAFSLMGLYLLLNVYLQQKTVHYWQQSNKVYTTIPKKFVWEDREKVFFLNSPDNFEGLLIYRTLLKDSGFKEVMEFINQKRFDGIFYDVLYYNMNELSDGVVVEQVDATQLKVELKEWGGWWHFNGYSAGSGYENEYYKVTPKGKYYLLDLKTPALDGTFIYQDGLALKEFILE